MKINNKNTYKTIKLLVVTLFFIIEINPDIKSVSGLWWASVAMLTVFTLFDIKNIKGTSKFRPGQYEFWILPFMLYAFVSILWAQNKADVTEYIPTFLVSALITIEISQIMRSEEDLDLIFKARFIATLLFLIYIIMNVDIMSLDGERLGSSVLGSGWNSNQVAIKLSIGVFIAIQEMRNNNSKLLKLILFVIVIAMIIVMVLCGSRTAFLVTIFGVCINIWFSSKGKKKLLIIPVIIGTVALFFYLVMNIPQLYVTIGWRLLNLQNALDGNAVKGSGTELRLRMIKKAFVYFKSSPIWGYGMNNFRELFGAETGIYYYSHCNYTEILTSFGLIGILLYFRAHISILFNGFRHRKTQNKRYAIFAICTVLSLLVTYFGTVLYMKTDDQILIAICFACIKFAKEGECFDAGLKIQSSPENGLNKN